MYNESSNGPGTVPLGTPDLTVAQSDLTPFTTTRCYLSQEGNYPFQSIPTNTIAL